MTTAPTPLLFPHVLDANRLDQLDDSHGLTQADLEWLHHAALPSHTLRHAQTPPMEAQTIHLQAEDKPSVPLAGCLTLKALTDKSPAAVKPAFLYTPYGGIQKFDSPEALDSHLENLLKDKAQRDELLRLLSISQRSELNGASVITSSRQTIRGDVFATLIESVEQAQGLNAQAMVGELVKLPSLAVMLDQVLNEVLSNFDHKQARVALSADAGPGTMGAGRVARNLSLAEAVLVYFHHQGRPAGHDVDFIHPGITTTPSNRQQWQAILRDTARNLLPKLAARLDAYWDAIAPFHAPRRDFLAQVISDGFRAAVFIQREKRQLTEAQSQELLRLYRSSGPQEPLLFVESVRLWEYAPLYVELAGSLMISGKAHYLYTPHHGLSSVDGHLGFKTALLGAPTSVARKDALYSLLSLQERNRFLRLDEPHVSGKTLSYPVFESLAEAIIDKQMNNLHYAMEMSRQGDMDVHALVDKALDIRSLINGKLLEQQAHGHWNTQPSFYGELRLSNFMADRLERQGNSYQSVEQAFNGLFSQLPQSTDVALDDELRALLPELTHVFSQGVRAEAELRELNGTLPPAAHDLIRTVFAFDAENPDRTQRPGVKGFRPDVYSLRLSCTLDGSTVSLPLPNCFLLTERGGLDTPYSGLGIFWSPADGLRAFSSVELATQQLNRYLLDSQRRFGLLANLPPAQRKPHGLYRLASFELIEDNVLVNRMNSFIDYFEAEHGYLRQLKAGDWRLAGPALVDSLRALVRKGAPTNLMRAAQIAEADRWQQKLPAWLGTAALEDQRLHIDLLEQYKGSVSDGKDYLDGVEPLAVYVNARLKTLLTARFADNKLDPATLLVTPKLALAGPARSLTEFALSHLNITALPGFKVSSSTGQKLPDNLNETAIRQILLSLDISGTYKNQVLEHLSDTGAGVEDRKRRFRRQVPWQLLQHAHARHLQQHLSPTAFDLIRQVLDIPDGLARQAVEGADAVIRPLELIKTAGATAVKALGLYLIGRGANGTGPQILYAPYHTGHSFTEFKDEASVVSTFNTPGALQDLLLRRLPEHQQATFKNLFASTVGHLSEITLAANPIQTNLLDTLFNDNRQLLSQMLDTQTDRHRQFDWETVLHLFSAGVKFVGRQLQGKLAFIETLWESYQDFKASAEALQQHDWKAGLHNFIAGASEMVSLGWMNRDDTFGLLAPVEPVAQDIRALTPPRWQDIASTAPTRTNLRVFQALGVSLADLQQSATDGIYRAQASGRFYTSVAGQVFEVAKANRTWRVVHENGEGPLLTLSHDRRKWLIDPQRQTIRYGKVMSTLANAYSDHKAGETLNIEARGMDKIRRKYPRQATVIVQALETARYYCANALDNLDRIKQGVSAGSRLDTFFKAFFGVYTVDVALIKKVHAAISPLCQALANPAWEWQNGQRIVIGSLKDPADGATAFVLEPEEKGRIYLTQLFFDPGLDGYKALVPQTFNVDAHAQAATLIHEISHQLYDTLDIIYLDAPLPFLDLISRSTHLGRMAYNQQEELQRHGLSLSTPRSKLFREWDSAAKELRSLEFFPRHQDTVKAILEMTGAASLDQARDAFLDPHLPKKRIDVILRNADSMTLLVCELGRQLDAA
ncbi:hypothetical protein BK652_26965 [Pseudomonas brassicacearum]|uniref:Dermonecrotic toxin N-terminal domain-containing protein n=1 Tax=Pseudomonas brassicacearum TaxID=930166 RepID=A0A423FTX6_9PSED|nr:DUF6543 domain-containing protein [Pseudomonas brassicacearum]ROM75793.1 hypothetical protein BK652_26965 [Pseudomonas brassicacearum]